jgi:diguanylate cyclase (GGDEF)-like protein
MDAPMTLAAQGGTLWFMMMMLSLAMFSGMSQCHYMMNLVYQATHDALTGVYTRQSGEDALSLLQRLAAMSGKPLSVAFVDVDRFKSVNDTFGHEAGDEVLRQLVQRVSAGLRRTDFVVRWGGEEFLVVLPDTPPEHIHGLFVRLREQGLGFRPDGEPLTASIGVASTSEPGVDDWHTLVTVADHRMYAAKQSGRDCIVLGDDVPRPFTARLAEQVA